MKSRVGTVILLCLLTATAFAQAPDNPDNAGRRPAEEAGGRDGPAAGGASTGIFAAIDADGDGAISKKELRNAAKALSPLDVDKDGSITRTEASAAAVAAVPGGPNGLPADPAQAVAEVMKNDKNGDGKLTANELPRDMARMMQDIDADADKSLTRDELMAAAQKMQNQVPGGAGGGLYGPWGAGGGVGRQDATGEFMRYDRNGDGRLSADEVPPQMKNMLQGGDKNNDGVIDPRELQEIIARMGSRARAAGAGGPNGRGPGDGGQGGVNRPGRNPPRN